MIKGQLTHLQTAQRRSWALLWLIIGLWLAVLMSGLAVVYSTHLSRQYFAELDMLKRETNDLHVEWGQYLIEQSTWSAFNRVESVAANRLRMHVPLNQQIVIIETP
jgi:cell division protein FtsL